MSAWVWITHDHRQLGQAPELSGFTVLGDKYAMAVKHCALAEPFTLPAAEASDIPDLLSQCDGVLFTGSPSNVDPSHFNQPLQQAHLPLDPQRDEITLPLVRACIAHNVPILGICRGFQEINVALGGSLHQEVHAVPSMMDHRERPSVPYAEQYAFSHTVSVVPDSPLAHWAAGAKEIMVNSLHGQGIDRLADELEPLAFAPDGLIEAVRVRSASQFAFAVQWHPEWRCQDNPFYFNIFKAFGNACLERHKQRKGQAPSKNTAG